MLADDPTVVVPIGFAPVAKYVRHRTPAMPESDALRLTVTLVLFHPLPFAAGVSDALVNGAVVSFACRVRPISVPHVSCEATNSPPTQMPVPFGSRAAPRKSPQRFR